ncbi:MAG: hypothetical protein A2622_06910 [Bdellovibrionales bacterium RIFCSPHIGHO2_01_FULL_40_29]|nr:MAG: hypothetical protein A2622_06910 [Bdellovibrionales bacterium RIFCSPHIGHO2_01_FULL_40_29]OFZ35169.1 MAG: hypothetical protein A3D17_07260 [Bdellovibrionales bacterium RIFCSPHIGHO2_02_FULL_40_15]
MGGVGLEQMFRFFLILFVSVPVFSQVIIPFSYWKARGGLLVISDGPTYNYGLVPTNNAVDKVFTVTNTSSSLASDVSGATFSSAAYTWKGGTFPGTGGTCGTSVLAGATCTVVVSASSATTGTIASNVVINYSSTTSTRAITAQFTATTYTSVFVSPNTGNFPIGNTQQLQCFGRTADGGVVELTASCSWSSNNVARVTVDDASNRGLITGIANGGPTTITATYGANSGTAAITVSAGAPTFPDEGIGLFARYYTITSGVASPHDPFTALVNQRIDAQVNFGWASGSNPAGGVNDFGVRWTGQISAASSGSYCVRNRSDDGARIWIDNTLVVDRWVDQGATNTNGTFTFTAGVKYNIVHEFYENGGDAEIRLQYQSIACVAPTAVPQIYLWPTALRAMDLHSATVPRYTDMIRGYAMNGAVGAIANGAAITGMSGGGAPTPVNATASNANGTGMAYVSSERSQAISFDGIDDSISVAASTVPTAASNRSISVWVNPTNTGSDQMIAFYGAETTSNGYGLAVLSNGLIRNYGWGNDCTSLASVAWDTWSMVTATYDGANARIYINGVLNQTCAKVWSTSAGSTLYVGRSNGGSMYFDGLIDDFAIWDTVLTAGEIYTIYERLHVTNPP